MPDRSDAPPPEGSTQAARPSTPPRAVRPAGGLTQGQLDGLDCIHCGLPANDAHPVGHIDGAQVFACESCRTSQMTAVENTIRVRIMGAPGQVELAVHRLRDVFATVTAGPIRPSRTEGMVRVYAEVQL